MNAKYIITAQTKISGAKNSGEKNFWKVIYSMIGETPLYHKEAIENGLYLVSSSVIKKIAAHLNYTLSFDTSSLTKGCHFKNIADQIREKAYA